MIGSLGGPISDRAVRLLWLGSGWLALVVARPWALLGARPRPPDPQTERNSRRRDRRASRRSRRRPPDRPTCHGDQGSTYRRLGLKPALRTRSSGPCEILSSSGFHRVPRSGARASP